jgi:hypothetical protein
MVADSDTPSDPEPTPTTDAHAPTTRRLVSQLTAQHAALAVLVAATVVGAALRLVALDARPIHYDEGVHLIETWELLTDGTYTYTGYRHGPPLIYLSALLFNVGRCDAVTPPDSLRGAPHHVWRMTSAGLANPRQREWVLLVATGVRDGRDCYVVGGDTAVWWR